MNFSYTIAGIWFLFLFMPGFVTNVAAQSTVSSDTLQQIVAKGKFIFTGKTPLSGGGPSCISCHSINDATLPVSGGNLAINITGFGALPHEALSQRIIEIPFPHMTLMKGAYKNHPVTPEEANKIIAYLKQVSEQGAAEVSTFPAGLKFLWVGLAGLMIILILIWLPWRKRKHGSVNKRIYQRQIQSV